MLTAIIYTTLIVGVLLFHIIFRYCLYREFISSFAVLFLSWIKSNYCLQPKTGLEKLTSTLQMSYSLSRCFCIIWTNAVEYFITNHAYQSVHCLKCFLDITKSRTVRQLVFYYMKKFHRNCLNVALLPKLCLVSQCVPWVINFLMLVGVAWRFRILQLQNRVMKPSYEKWRHTSSY